MRRQVMLTSLWHRLRAPFLYLAPEETASCRVMPVTLLLRPLPLFALVVLVVNDQWLKAASLLPALVTGKLSDVAGLFFAPLLLVTLVNMTSWTLSRVIQVWTGNRAATWSLSTPTLTQLALASAAVGIGFTLVQVHLATAAFYAEVMSSLSFWNSSALVPVTSDASDLLALPALIGAMVFGRSAIVAFPPGRLALLEEAAQHARELDLVDAETELLHVVTDVLSAMRSERVSALEDLVAHVLAGRPAEVIDVDLERLRGELPPRTSPLAS